MSKAAAPSRWFKAWRPAPRVEPDDPADQGTAFGLDMSLLDDAPPPGPAPRPARAPWAQRLGFRRPKPVA